MKIGILGAGKIGPKFAKEAVTIPGVSIAAVGSRSEDRAREFGAEFGADQIFGSYEQFIENAEVDLVYVATPHISHCELTLACLRKGHPVLVEKAFAINTQEAHQMVALAKETRVFLMEAMWSRFMPSLIKAKEWLEAGMIGQVCNIQADFGFKAQFDPERRLFNPKLGGGALLDIGIYPVFLAYLFSGEPESIEATAIIGSTGVDEELGIIFHYQNHLAHLQSSFRTTTPCEAHVYGTEGVLKIHSRWHHSSKISISFFDGRSEVQWESTDPWIGYRYEALHVKQCLEQGLSESPIWSLEDSLALMNLLDQIRGMIGLKYPSDLR